MPVTKNTYKGMNQDMSKTSHSPDFYYEGRDIRTITEEGLSTTSIENEKGNEYVNRIPPTLRVTTLANPSGVSYGPGAITFTTDTATYTNTTTFNEPATGAKVDLWQALREFVNTDPGLSGNGLVLFAADETLIWYKEGEEPTNFSWSGRSTSRFKEPSKIIGEGRIRDDIYYFTTLHTNYPGEIGFGYIWKFSYTLNPDQTLAGSAVDLKYAGALGFSAEFPIGDEIEGRYEAPDIQKLYWVDGKHQMRFINIAAEQSELEQTVPDNLNTVPTESLEAPLVTNVTSGGNFGAGIVQYAYQFVTENGGTTARSPLSNPVTLTESSSGDTSRDYFGTPVGGDSKKAVTVQITNIPTRFKFAKIYRIYYTDEFNDPQIDLVSTESTAGGVVDLIDNGTITLGAVSPAQFTGLGSTVFIPQSLATKDNRLFLANNKEEDFEVDFDARAYRFNSSGLGYYISGTSGTRISSANWGSIDVEEDTFNPYNQNFNEVVAGGDKYAYQEDGTTIGGIGPNVSYTFFTEQIFIDDDGNSYSLGPLLGNERQFTINPADTNLQLGPTTAKERAGYKRGEVYRFGLRFVSKKGLTSFVKWIGDIKMPDTSDNGAAFRAFEQLGTGEITGKNLYPVFNINLSGLSAGLLEQIDYVEIMRVERTEADKTILGQGAVSQLFTFNDGTDAEVRVPPFFLMNNEMAYPYLDSMALAPAVFSTTDPSRFFAEFVCPDEIFNKNITHQADDYLRFQSVANYVTRNGGCPFDVPPSGDERYVNIQSENTPLAALAINGLIAVDNDRYVVEKARSWDTRVNASSSHVKNVIVDAVSINGTKGLTNTIQGVTVENKVEFEDTELVNGEIAGNTTGGKEGRGNSKMLMRVTNDMHNFGWIDFALPTAPGGTNGPDCGFVIADYKRPLTIQYGGYDHNARVSNNYITTHNRAHLDGSTSYSIRGKGGDTYVCMFDYLRISVNDNQNSTLRRWQEVMFIPLETSINLNLRHDRSWNYLASKTGDRVYAPLQESFAFAQSQPTFGPDLDDEQTDLYLFNETYIRHDKLIVGQLESPISKFSDTFDTQIRYSLEKFDGETEDSWTQYLADNKNQVDAKYGAITKIFNHADELIWVQPEGYGRYAVNPRVQTTASDGEPIELGTGGVLHDYTYSSTKFGTNQKFGIVSSQLNYYFIDSRTFKLVKTGQGTGNISDILGISSTLRNLITSDLQNNYNPYLLDGIRASYDRRFNEILFTIKQSNGEDETIAFNELSNTFSSFYGYRPPIYNDDATSFFSSDDRINIYRHHFGERGVYYDQAPVEMSVTIIVNPDADLTKRFDNTEWYSQIFDPTTGLELFDETITAIRFYNDYQDSGIIPLTNLDNLRRRMRKWRMHIARDQADGKSRMRNPYLFVTLYFDNNNNKKLVLHHLMTYYDIRPY
jgi:hypothetical protein